MQAGSEPFPKTYWNDNPEDRDYLGDLWAWLQHQPHDAWLLWVRHANWDNAERVFERMLEDPECDLAIVAWLFWNAGPADHLGRSTGGRSTGLVAQILRNLQSGYYRRAELFLDPHEICGGALRLAARLQSGGEHGFVLPRALCGPFRGRRAHISSSYDPQVEAELEEVLRYSNGRLPRSEEEHWTRARGNLWTIGTLTLPECPANPQVHFSGKSDVEYLEAIFGRADELEMARKRSAVGHPPTLLERIFYGEVFLGEQRQLDLAWKRWLAVSAAMTAIVLLSTRLPLDRLMYLAIVLPMALAIGFVLTFVQLGRGRKLLWLAVATLFVFVTATLLRWINHL